MATKLKAKDPKEAKIQRPKMLIDGEAGVGKTMFSLRFPNSYYIDCEGGATGNHYTDILKKSGGAYLGIEDGALDFPTVIEQFKALASEEHNFKTVIIDSISKLFNSAVATEAETLGDKDVFGASRKKPIAQMRQLLNWTNRIDMNVVFVAHTKVEYGSDGKGGRTEIGKIYDCWDKLGYELHLWIQVFKQGASRKARVKKSRLVGFPDAEVFDFDYETFSAKWGKDIIEAKAEKIELATEAQVTELKRLVTLLNTPEETIKAWLKKAESESFEEMTSKQVEACIKYQTEQFNKGNK